MRIIDNQLVTNCFGPYVIQKTAKNRGTKIILKNPHITYKFSDFSCLLALASGRRRPRRGRKSY